MSEKTAYRKNTVVRWIVRSIFQIILSIEVIIRNVQGFEISEIANFVILANLSTVYDTARILSNLLTGGLQGIIFFPFYLLYFSIFCKAALEQHLL